MNSDIIARTAVLQGLSHQYHTSTVTTGAVTSVYHQVRLEQQRFYLSPGSTMKHSIARCNSGVTKVGVTRAATDSVTLFFLKKTDDLFIHRPLTSDEKL